MVQYYPWVKFYFPLTRTLRKPKTKEKVQMKDKTEAKINAPVGGPKFLLLIARLRKQKGNTFLIIMQTLLEFASYWEAQCLLCTLGQSKSADNWILIYGKNIKKWKRQEKNLTASIPFVGIALVITANQRLCHSWAAIWYNIIEELSVRINTAVDQGLQARTMDKFLF